MDISFVILSWNSGKFIYDSLDSIFKSIENTGYSFEIFVVDNGSSDNSVALIQQISNEHQGAVFPILLDYNSGTTYSRNLALKKATGRYICIMDSDVVLQAGVVETLINVLDSEAGIGMAVPQIRYPSGKWQKSFDRFPTLFHKINRFFRLRAIEEHDAKLYGNVQDITEVDYAISALWLIKRELLNSVGLLDEKIFYSPEDVDYCIRVWQAGYKIVYVPTVIITHHTQEISRGWKLNRSKFSHIKGILYLNTKHGYFLKSPDFKQRLL